MLFIVVRNRKSIPLILTHRSVALEGQKSGKSDFAEWFLNEHNTKIMLILRIFFVQADRFAYFCNMIVNIEESYHNL